MPPPSRARNVLGGRAERCPAPRSTRPGHGVKVSPLPSIGPDDTWGLTEASLKTSLERPHHRAELRGIDGLLDQAAVAKPLRLCAQLGAPASGHENQRGAG